MKEIGYNYKGIIKALVFLGLIVSMTACSNIQSSDRTFVKAQLEESRLGGGKSYALVFNNEEAQSSLKQNKNAVTALHLALENKGYVEAQIAANADLFIVLDCGFAGERVGYKEKALTPQQLNPDSIRYKNVAGMVAGGRYKGLLDDDPFSSARENLAAFDDAGAPLKERHIDEVIKKREGGASTRLEAAVQYTTYLTVGAWRPVKSNGQLDIEEVWEVTVVNDQFDENLKSRLEKLAEASAYFIETDTKDWQEIKKKN